MNVLILTSPEHLRFVNDVAAGYGNAGEDYLIHWYGSKYEFEPAIDYDIGVSYMYQYKVPKEQLDKTWFNFHPAPLPEYKGRNLCYHAIVNGARSFGATVHYMDENFDTGCIIETLDFLIKESWTAQDLHDKVMEASRTLFQKFYPLILTGREFGCTANEGGQYYRKEPIEDYLFLSDQYDLSKQVRAITYGSFYPRIDIGGKTYKIVRDE